MKKEFPLVGNYVYVEYLTDLWITQRFHGLCVYVNFDGPRSSFILANLTTGVKQTFIFHSALLQSVIVKKSSLP